MMECCLHGEKDTVVGRCKRGDGGSGSDDGGNGITEFRNDCGGDCRNGVVRGGNVVVMVVIETVVMVMVVVEVVEVVVMVV